MTDAAVVADPPARLDGTECLGIPTQRTHTVVDTQVGHNPGVSGLDRHGSGPFGQCDRSDEAKFGNHATSQRGDEASRRCDGHDRLEQTIEGIGHDDSPSPTVSSETAFS